MRWVWPGQPWTLGTGGLRAWYHVPDTRKERLLIAEAGSLYLLPLCPIAGTGCVSLGRPLPLSLPPFLPVLLGCFWEGGTSSGRSSVGAVHV